MLGIRSERGSAIQNHTQITDPQWKIVLGPDLRSEGRLIRVSPRALWGRCDEPKFEVFTARTNPRSPLQDARSPLLGSFLMHTGDLLFVVAYFTKNIYRRKKVPPASSRHFRAILGRRNPGPFC